VGLDLRPKEFDLLALLAAHPGQVFTRETLLNRIWGYHSYIDPRTVDVHVRRLREKLAAIDPEATVIETERGVGYRLRG
jgi:DNA-binding response OmpR family regulator